MKNQIVRFLFLVGITFGQQVEPESGGFFTDTYTEFIEGKSVDDYLWYTGVGFTVLSSISLIIGSHYDGLAAIDRNEAAFLFESGENEEAYRLAYNRTKRLENKRDVYWKVGLVMGLVGTGIMAYEIFTEEDVSVQARLDGFQVRVGF